MKIILLLVWLAIGDTVGARMKRASGGKEILIEEAPHVVSLRLEKRHVCVGTLISTRHVLTAAHCVLDPSLRPLSGIIVVSGKDKIDRADVGHGIQNISPHEGFLEGRSSCDIAVVTLLFHVERNGKQKEIALPNAEIPYGVQAKLVGFKLHVSKLSNTGLRELTVKINHVPEPSNNPDDYDKVFYGILPQYQFISNASEVLIRAGVVLHYNKRSHKEFIPTRLKEVTCRCLSTGSLDELTVVSVDDQDQVDAGAAVVYNGTIVGFVLSKAGNNRGSCYCINVVKFKTFIEESMENTFPNSQRQSVIQWAPKRPRL